MRKLGGQQDTSYKAYETYVETRLPEVVANILICLIRQTNFPLDQLIRKLDKAFVQEGGLRERMTRARLAERALWMESGHIVRAGSVDEVLHA